MRLDINDKDFLKRCYKALCYARWAVEIIGDKLDLETFDYDVEKILNGEKTDIENIVDFYELDK